MTKENIVKKLAKHNDKEYNILKAIEECNELSLALTQHLSKNSVSNQEIIDEIGDVYVRVGILKEMFDPERISKRINRKLSSLEKHYKNKKYKNKI